MSGNIHNWVMCSLAVLQDSPGGCELPEALRRYYLDAMGIQAWELLEGEAAVANGESTKESTGRALQDEAVSRQWLRLQQTVSDCSLCDLHASRTQTVFGVGNKNAELLVIGEAPGHDEDLQGEPFVGRAGQLLTAMLLAIGLKRDDVYIANILKCRPPGNRDPEAAEIEHCNAYLREQIELIRPAAIFSLGRIASQALLKSSDTMAAMRGKQHSYEGVPLIASYHPAYLLRKPSEKRKSWQDLLQLKRLLDSCR